jgi:hypothetical protein
MANTKGAAGKAGHAYPSGAPDVTFIYLRVCIVQALVLSVVFFYDSVFVPVSPFFCWSCRPFDIKNFDYVFV